MIIFKEQVCLPNSFILHARDLFVLWNISFLTKNNKGLNYKVIKYMKGDRRPNVVLFVSSI